MIRGTKHRSQGQTRLAQDNEVGHVKHRRQHEEREKHAEAFRVRIRGTVERQDQRKRVKPRVLIEASAPIFPTLNPSYH